MENRRNPKPYAALCPARAPLQVRRPICRGSAPTEAPILTRNLLNAQIKLFRLEKTFLNPSGLRKYPMIRKYLGLNGYFWEQLI